MRVLRGKTSETNEVVLEERKNGNWDISISNVDMQQLNEQRSLLNEILDFTDDGDFGELEGLLNMLDEVCDPYLDDLERC